MQPVVRPQNHNSIIDHIAQHGPLSAETFMSLCLQQYYKESQALGSSGDFITAPEISQLFGEILAAFLIHQWQMAGSPALCHLIEVGPGRGVLMADILRTAQCFPQFFTAIKIHLVEVNRVLRAQQQQVLAPYQIIWHENLSTLPTDAPWFMIGNEFLDTFPVAQWIHVENNWHERYIQHTPNGLMRSYSPSVTSSTDIHIPAHLVPKEGDIWEYSKGAATFITQISHHLRQQSGTAVFIDYGYTFPGFGDTIQSIYRHKPVDIFSAPGEVDITAHVNFSSLKDCAIAADMQVTLATQREFLIHLGIHQRASHLRGDRPTINAAVERLISPEAMGQLFKVMVMHYGC
jgi:NADH dehydrogenase [ubiquinone] 1 alpha subcomplex assembly factor 7